jgi:hypothetical protein
MHAKGIVFRKTSGQPGRNSLRNTYDGIPTKVDLHVCDILYKSGKTDICFPRLSFTRERVEKFPRFSLSRKNSFEQSG